MPISDLIAPGHVAVVTGAASGIGKAACAHFARAGMSVCLADMDRARLDETAAEIADIAPDGTNAVLACHTDVSSMDDLGALRYRIMAKFGKVNLLMNNAVTRIGRGHDARIEDWQKAMDVNFWGVVNGVRRFLPEMLALDEPKKIINVGSKQGITNPPGHPIYNITKSALKTYTEALEHELRSIPENAGENRLAAHLLIPGWTTTGTNEHKQGAWLPDQVIEFMIRALEQDRFYIVCPDDEVTEEMDQKRILWGAQDITAGRPPLSRWHPDYKDAANEACS